MGALVPSSEEVNRIIFMKEGWIDFILFFFSFFLSSWLVFMLCRTDVCSKTLVASWERALDEVIVPWGEVVAR